MFYGKLSECHKMLQRNNSTVMIKKKIAARCKIAICGEGISALLTVHSKKQFSPCL